MEDPNKNSALVRRSSSYRIARGRNSSKSHLTYSDLSGALENLRTHYHEAERELIFNYTTIPLKFFVDYRSIENAVLKLTEVNGSKRDTDKITKTTLKFIVSELKFREESIDGYQGLGRVYLGKLNEAWSDVYELLGDEVLARACRDASEQTVESGPSNLEIAIEDERIKSFFEKDVSTRAKYCESQTQHKNFAKDFARSFSSLPLRIGRSICDRNLPGDFSYIKNRYTLYWQRTVTDEVRYLVDLDLEYAALLYNVYPRLVSGYIRALEDNNGEVVEGFKGLFEKYTYGITIPSSLLELKDIEKDLDFLDYMSLGLCKKADWYFRKNYASNSNGYFYAQIRKLRVKVLEIQSSYKDSENESKEKDFYYYLKHFASVLWALSEDFPSPRDSIAKAAITEHNMQVINAHFYPLADDEESNRRSIKFLIEDGFSQFGRDPVFRNHMDAIYFHCDKLFKFVGDNFHFDLFLSSSNIEAAQYVEGKRLSSFFKNYIESWKHQVTRIKESYANSEQLDHEKIMKLVKLDEALLSCDPENGEAFLDYIRDVFLPKLLTMYDSTVAEGSALDLTKSFFAWRSGKREDNPNVVFRGVLNEMLAVVMMGYKLPEYSSDYREEFTKNYEAALEKLQGIFNKDIKSHLMDESKLYQDIEVKVEERVSQRVLLVVYHTQEQMLRLYEVDDYRPGRKVSRALESPLYVFDWKGLHNELAWSKSIFNFSYFLSNEQPTPIKDFQARDCDFIGEDLEWTEHGYIVKFPKDLDLDEALQVLDLSQNTVADFHEDGYNPHNPPPSLVQQPENVTSVVYGEEGVNNPFSQNTSSVYPEPNVNPFSRENISNLSQSGSVFFGENNAEPVNGDLNTANRPDNQSENAERDEFGKSFIRATVTADPTL